jgi:hypothetical protein
MEKLEMQRETLRLQDGVGRNGEPIDVVVYGLTVTR